MSDNSLSAVGFINVSKDCIFRVRQQSCGLLSLFRLFDPGMEQPEDIAGTFFHTHLLAPRAICHASCMINADTVIIKAYRLGRTYLDAHLAGDAPSLADCLDCFSRITGTAGDPDAGI